MKKIITLLLLLLPTLLLFAQVDTSAVQANPAGAEPIEDDSWLLIMGTILLLGFATAVVFGFVGLGIAAVVLAGLTMAGILSVSIIAAWYKRSMYAGFKWFVYLSFCVAGIAGVSLIALIVRASEQTSYSMKTLLSWGIPAGIAGGLVGGWIVLLICRKLYQYFNDKLALQQ